MTGQLKVNINLLKPEPRITADIFRWGVGLLILGIMAAGIYCFTVTQNRELRGLEAENLKLREEIKNNEALMDLPQPLPGVKQELTDISPVLKALEGSRISYVEIMNEIDRAIPSGVIIVGVELKPSRVVLTGFSSNHSQVADLVDGFKNSPRFQEVSVCRSEAYGQAEEDQFNLEIVWEAEIK